MRESLFRDLAKLLGDENVFCEAADLAAHASGPGFAPERQAWPVAVVRPRYKSQISRLIQYCGERGIALRWRGAGTVARAADFYSGAVLVLSGALDTLLDIDPASGIAHAQAGVSMARLAANLAEHGLFFPSAASFAPLATVGGIFAVNEVSGSSRKYGPVAAWLFALNALPGSGDELYLSSENLQAGKIDSALPLASLFCGSYGSLGFIESVKLKVMPYPEKGLDLCISGATDQQLAEIALLLQEKGLLPARLELAGQQIAEKIFDRRQPFMLLRLEGACAEVTNDFARLEGVLKAFALAPEPLPQELSEKLGKGLLRNWPLYWQEGRTPHLFTELACPPGLLPDCLTSLQNLCNEANCDFAFSCLADVARLRLLFYGPDQKGIAALATRLAGLELMLNNRLESEAEATMSRREWEKSHNRELALSDKIKELFDPHGIFSPRQ